MLDMFVLKAIHEEWASNKEGNEMKRLALLLIPALAACSVEDRVLASQRQILAPYKDKFCAMSEQQKNAYLLQKLKIANESGGYIRGKYYDTTVVLSSDLGAEHHEYRKITGC